MSKGKTATPTAVATPFPTRGGSFVLDATTGALTQVPVPVETADAPPVQDPVETVAEPTPEKEPQ